MGPGFFLWGLCFSRKARHGLITLATPNALNRKANPRSSTAITALKLETLEAKALQAL